MSSGSWPGPSAWRTFPVAVLLLAGLGAFVYGTALFVNSVGHVVDHPFPIKHQIGLFLEVIDLFLIGATLLISSVGFFELFIYDVHRDGSTRIPTWLHMRDLNDLKARVIAMIVLVVSVSFVEVVVDSPSGAAGPRSRGWDCRRRRGLHRLFATGRPRERERVGPEGLVARLRAAP